MQTPPFTPLTGSLTFNSDGSLDPDDAGACAAGDSRARGQRRGHVRQLEPVQRHDAAHQPVCAALVDFGGFARRVAGGPIGLGGDRQTADRSWRSSPTGSRPWWASSPWRPFEIPQSLIAVGNNNYQLSASSALPAVGLPGTGGRGTVKGGAVEASTVDIATEFTNLIVYQRGYEANSKVSISGRRTEPDHHPTDS